VSTDSEPASSNESAGMRGGVRLYDYRYPLSISLAANSRSASAHALVEMKTLRLIFHHVFYYVCSFRFILSLKFNNFLNYSFA